MKRAGRSDGHDPDLAAPTASSPEARATGVLRDPDGALGTFDTSPPRLPRTYVPRQRLFAQLDRATKGSVTLLVAPAGAGKTLGAAGWLRATGPEAAPDDAATQHRRDALWIRADASWDGDRIDTLLDLTRNSLVDRSTQDAADPGAPGRPAGTTFAPARLVVIDDAHLLPASAVRAIDRRLNDAPDTMRLLLLSRWDLPLTRLAPELMGHFCVLRGEVLRMSDHEAAVLIAVHAGTTSTEVIEAITARTQGWCAAVVLTSRAVAAAPDPVTAAREYARGDTEIADRVASEVFSALAPRERHVLLCTAAEDELPASTAAALSNDPQAGEILAGLATTGLLVTRLGTDGTVGVGRLDPGAPDAVYRIHPLLAEVVRRRLVAGGVDVSRARAAVGRAVRLDLARGDASRAFDRLVAVNDVEVAADVLATEGLTMVLRGAGPGIAAFVRRHCEVVEMRPQTWFAIAVERWAADEIEAAAHWMDRILQHHGGDSPQDDEPVAATASVLACVRLMRARLGLEPMAAAVDHAQRVVLASLHDGNQPHAVQSVSPQLLTELGVTQSWLGDLARAEVNLTAAVATCRSRHLPALAAEATSHLAFTEYMAGKERAAVQVATEALAILGQGLPWRPRFAAHRASLVLLLAGLVDLPLPDAPIDPPEQPTPVHTADLCTRFWLRLREARLALTAGSVAETERILSTPLNVPVVPEQLPEHLQVALVVERAFLASLSSDQQALRGFEQQLTALRATGEAALVAGLRADLAGDRRGAASLFEEAAGTTSYPQPASQALALGCQAQLLDALGEHDRALDRLREAARLTELRRNAVPFLGWSRQGTPMQTLLTRLLEVTGPAPGAPSAAHEWVRGLAAAAAGKPDIASMFAPVTPTVQERTARAALVVQPTLSPREREVLNGLARGATYADIAANLFVSENTIKTHVSSLYGKLAVARRSDALAVARRLHLL